MNTPKQISTRLGHPVHIDNYSDFLHYACLGNVHNLFNNEAFMTCNSGWAGTTTYQDAVDLAHNGWKHGTAKAMFLADDLLSKMDLPLVESSMYLDTTTQYCWDISSAVAGVPQCGVNFAEEQDKKQIRLLVNLASSAAVSSDTILSRASIICALAKALEQTNYAVEITVGQASSRRNDSLLFQYTVVVKHFTQVIDMDLLSFAIGHVAMARRLSNAFICNTLSANAAKSYDDDSWGIPCAITGVESDINIPHMSSWDNQWSNAAKATAWLTAELMKQGIALNG